METAEFRFTNELTVSIEFNANIATVEHFQADLAIALTEYASKYKGKTAALHMRHSNQWMPLNRDSSCQTIYAKTQNPRLWAERMASEILWVWQDVVHYSDQLNNLMSSAVKAVEQHRND